MKLTPATAPVTTLPSATRSRELADTQSRGALETAQSQNQTRQSRPVRIARQPEAAAVFAYNAQAELPGTSRSPTIDEYI